MSAVGSSVPEEVGALVAQLGDEWACAADRATPLSGGISNTNYLVTRGGENDGRREEEDVVVVKLFGAGTSLFVDRARENEILSVLSSVGIAPKVLVSGEHGRVEAFLGGYRALVPAEMGDLRMIPLIARALAELHNVTDVPCHGSGRIGVGAESKPVSVLWPTLRKWLEMAVAVRTESDATWFRHEAVKELIDQLEVELSESSVHEHEFVADLDRTVLCHNDLLSGNIMCQSDSVKLIDYEYCGYNPAGFDVANHFSEYGGFEYDPASFYPSDEQQRAFIRAYMTSRKRSGGEAAVPWPRVHRRLHQYAVASSLWWGLWAVIQSSVSHIDFDYATYARLRLTTGINFHLDAIAKL
ncbi:putative choline kinase 2 [Porphyridium purpureum]|uniref:ethanolamine kinase n=1 Tax=Porphyridium purpureum TaxID=35688 RepID=A0A5J4YQJ3_PORPP|nr:putative choline kinase 2 [Porphyridium purpureum]|eukprot:POR2478..scf296_7